ncbi:unnamed protein product [Arctia plantaginis]|uniref:Uncharacterized protein n=1 Tax=Arctia plantaginis TaxID=874455 RepID=A0A8S1ADS3_ARCPL|nr:unnamed protein product [Arctia plantaginis]
MSTKIVHNYCDALRGTGIGGNFNGPAYCDSAKISHRSRLISRKRTLCTHLHLSDWLETEVVVAALYPEQKEGFLEGSI